MAKKPGLAVAIAIGKPKHGADLGTPAGFGRPPRAAKSAPPTPAADTDADEGMDDDDSTTPAAVVTPEAVHYHDEEQRCELCAHFGQDGNCALLQMPVQAEGGCNAFHPEASTDDGSDMDADQDSDEDMTPAMPPGRGGARGGYGAP